MKYIQDSIPSQTLPHLIEGFFLKYQQGVTKSLVESEIKRIASRDKRNGIAKWYIKDPMYSKDQTS